MSDPGISSKIYQDPKVNRGFEYQDPSADLCIIYDTLQDLPPDDPAVSEGIGWYSSASQSELTPRYIIEDATRYPDPVYCDTTRYLALQKIKDAFNHPNFEAARNACNP